jgi:hypothetical protein
MSWKSWFFTLITMIGIVLPGSADAALLQRPLPLPELVSQADGIFIAQVVGMMGTRSTPRGEIFTEVTLRVHSSLKGRTDPDGSIRLLLPGGEVGDETEIVRGAARVSPGEQVMVFAARDASGCWRVVGMAQGKYSLTQDRTGRPIATNDLTGLYIMVPDTLAQSLESREAPSQQLPLENLIHQVQQVLQPSLVMR